MNFFGEFKKFAMRGNVMDMAVGIILGAAFGKIVSSLVADVIMPPIGLLIGGVNFSDLAWTIKPAIDSTPAVSIKYGNFIQMILDFLVVAFAIFLFIKALNKLTQTSENLLSKVNQTGENLLSIVKGQKGNEKANNTPETPAEPAAEATPAPAPAEDTPIAPASEALSKASLESLAKQEALLTEIRDLLAKK